MKSIITICFTMLAFFQASFAQDSNGKTKKESPYSVSFRKDAPIIAGGVGLTFLGTYLISQKDSLTNQQVAAKTRDKLPFFDRGNAGFYSEKADDDSYVPFKFSFALPVVMALIDKDQRHHAGQVLTLYVETMAVTGALFTMATGNVYRSRPYVYLPAKGPDVPDAAKRRENDSHRSFYAGHTAATAAATFFAAKVYQDFHPDSKFRYVMWGIGAATPALVGYLRYRAGMHFLSDNILGYVMGAGAGILIPQLHKSKKMQNVSISPMAGVDYKGMVVTYKF